MLISDVIGHARGAVLTRSDLHWLGLGLLFALYYAPTVPELVNDWYEHQTFSYGFLVPFITAYLIRLRWRQIKSIHITPSPWVGIPLLLAVFLGVLGQAVGDVFSIRISMILALALGVWLLFGVKMLKAVLFPISYLLLMIPLPYVVIKDLTYQLRYWDAAHAGTALQLLGIPVHVEAYFIHLPKMMLEVADVCSGVSSVFALFSLGVIYAHWLPIKNGLKVLLVVCTFPLAMIANLIRIVITAVLAYHIGPAVLQSTFHSLTGTTTFIVALAMFVGVGEYLRQNYSYTAFDGHMMNENAARPALASGRGFYHWASFWVYVSIFAIGVLLSALLSKGTTMTLGTDLSEVVDSRAYSSVQVDSSNLYQDPNANNGLSMIVDDGGGGPIELFIGYRGEQFAGQRLQSPKINFPEHWNSVWVKPADIEVVGEHVIHGNWMLTRKGNSNKFVLYWYQIGSSTFAGELENRVRQVKRALTERRTDGAVVRLATQITEVQSLEDARKRLTTFSVDLYPRLISSLPK